MEALRQGQIISYDSKQTGYFARNKKKNHTVIGDADSAIYDERGIYSEYKPASELDIIEALYLSNYNDFIAPSDGESTSQWKDEDMENEKLFDILRDDRKESDARMAQMEIRLTKIQADSEARMNAALEKIAKDQAESEKRIETRIDTAVKEISGARGWIIAVCLATIVGIAGMVITILCTLPT